MSGIHRIQQQFARGKVFAGYLTVGDGGIERTLQAVLALIEAGVNLLELGVPFSDPIADGPIIQRAAARALSKNTSLADIIQLARAIRQHSNIPLILFSYLNPLLTAFETDFCAQAAQAGIDGMLIVDCPVEESIIFQQILLAHQLAPIYVITPSTPLTRVNKIDKCGAGFLYYACRRGTTGIKSSLPVDFIEKIELIKTEAKLPILTGFGISRKTTAAEALTHTDGVVVGSLFVKALEEGMTPAELTQLAASINPLRYTS